MLRNPWLLFKEHFYRWHSGCLHCWKCSSWSSKGQEHWLATKHLERHVSFGTEGWAQIAYVFINLSEHIFTDVSFVGSRLSRSFDASLPLTLNRHDALSKTSTLCVRVTDVVEMTLEPWRCKFLSGTAPVSLAMSFEIRFTTCLSHYLKLLKINQEIKTIEG